MSIPTNPIGLLVREESVFIDASNWEMLAGLMNVLRATFKRLAIESRE